MLEVLSKFICFLIMAITGFYVIKKITNSEAKILETKNILLIMIMVFIQILLYKSQYTISYTLIVFLLNIIIYKSIFKMNMEDTIISCGIFTIILFFSDIIISTIYRLFFTLDEIRSHPIVSVLVNISTGVLSEGVSNIKIVMKKIGEFYSNAKTKKTMANIVFITLLIVSLCYLGYYITTYKIYDASYIVSVVLIILLSLIAYIFINSKNSYNQLSDEYDTLFSYVQNFEDWIEKEQLNRHEYKNQLAVLRSIAKDKKVKNKIDEILEDNINIEGEVVHKLKELPKGGLKGLVYYKVAIAQKQKINIEVDVSLKKKSLFKNLSELQIKVLCKLIGIYFDNAIEAANVTKKKVISLEVYEIKDKVKIVISNTFKKTKNFARRNERGVTTKGKGRGNGLYYANSLLSKNDWLESKQDVIDNYYIQLLTIKN